MAVQEAEKKSGLGLPAELPDGRNKTRQARQCCGFDLDRSFTRQLKAHCRANRIKQREEVEALFRLYITEIKTTVACKKVS